MPAEDGVKPRLLLIADPIGGGASVQFELISSLFASLKPRYRVSVYSPYCEPDRRKRLQQMGCEIITPPSRGFRVGSLLDMLDAGNESMLWAESWLREAFLGKNAAESEKVLRDRSFDFTLNLSMTIPAPSDLWWVLGTPLDQTIAGMKESNVLALAGTLVGKGWLAHLDHRVVGRIQSQTRRVVANSPYLQQLHRERGVPVEGVIYTLTDLSDFKPIPECRTDKYVLLYLGKETRPIAFDSLKRSGVRLVAFGSKIPVGTRLRQIRESVDYLGRVSREHLISLYSNALFTLFPFTCEPMGLVPIESMACGTPVLTFNQQGPATTVIDGSTGWLVGTPDEMVAKTKEIWKRGETGISRESCVRRAKEFTAQRSAIELMQWIERSAASPASNAPSPESHAIGASRGAEATA